MTDTKPDHTADSGSTTQANPNAAKPSAAKAGSRPAKSSRRPAILIVFLVLLLIVAALAAAVWYQQRTMQERGSALLSQAQQSTESAQAAAGQAAQALSLARTQATQIETLQASLGEAQQHLQSLEQALQMLTDNGTEVALINDIDHLVSIAHQQLLLGGNVSNAIIALETAQAQLARANRPSLVPLQQAINGDVERLRAVSTVDVNRLSSRIDELGRLIETAPLLIPDDAAPKVDSSGRPQRQAAPAPSSTQPDPADPWWKRSLSSAADWSRQAWWSIRQDLGSFINVRRVDDAAALLMSSEQASSLRDKLRLRLMTAQLAVLMNQPDVWQTETRAVVQLLQARYDISSVDGHRALRLALQLADTSIQIELPSLANSQSAIQALREAQVKSAAPAQNGADSATEDAAGANANDGKGNVQQNGASPDTPENASPPAGNEPDAPPADTNEPANGSSSGDAGVPAEGNAPATATATESASVAIDQVGV